MNVRQTLSEQPVWGIAAGVLLLLVATIAMTRQLRSDRPAHRTILSRAYYTTDDGKTLFTNSGDVPPFMSGGKEAVKAMVYSGDGGRDRFVAYLVKFTPVAKQKVESLSSEELNGGRLGGPVTDLVRTGMLVKKPGIGSWISTHDHPAEAAEIMRIVNPVPGESAEQVLPP